MFLPGSPKGRWAEHNPGVAERWLFRRGYARRVEYGEPISYLTLEPGAEVVSSDGQRVGRVEHVLYAADEDIFDGLVIDTETGPGGLHFVDAPEVDEIYERAVVLKIPAAEVDQLPKPTPAPAALEHHGVEDTESRLQAKLHRAWDYISGNY
jgi:hypothetical protein